VIILEGLEKKGKLEGLLTQIGNSQNWRIIKLVKEQYPFDVESVKSLPINVFIQSEVILISEDNWQELVSFKTFDYSPI
jgi:hypothetical protein